MLSIFRPIVCSIFLLMAIGCTPHARCQDNLPRSSFHNDKIISDILTNTAKEQTHNITLKCNISPEDGIRIFFKENYTIIKRIMDAFSTIMTSKKLLYLARYNPAQLYEIITICMIQLSLNSSGKTKSVIMHPMISSILLILIYRLSMNGVAPLTQPWILFSIIQNGLSCSTIHKLVNGYCFPSIKRALHKCKVLAISA